MNALGKPFNKMKKRQNSKNRSQNPTYEQKTTSKKANFCSNGAFSHYFKTKVNQFHAAKPLAFPLHFLFRFQNHHFSLNSKIMKMREVKKDTSP